MHSAKKAAQRTLESPTTARHDRVQQVVAPGAKLLCINASGLRRTYTPGSPVEGRIYCVRELYEEDGVQGVLLVGIVGPRNHAGLECGFLLARFRWVHE